MIGRNRKCEAKVNSVETGRNAKPRRSGAVQLPIRGTGHHHLGVLRAEHGSRITSQSSST
jgi:hypothetical protein